MFTEIFGNSTRVKLLDFLADHVDFDYTISQIEEFTEISRPTLYRLIGELEAEKMISLTRLVGASKFYALDTRNEKVIEMLRMEFEAINRNLLGQRREPSAQPISPSATRFALAEPRRTLPLMARRPVTTAVKFKKRKKKSRKYTAPACDQMISPRD